jgi:hypothetical protein
VDAVLLIGEHGEYPRNSRGQKMYPRYELFEPIAQVFRKSRRVVPLFNDKHLSYSWEKAKKMYDTAREMKIPFMAGSSIPVTVRVPELEIPFGSKIEHAVAVGYGDMDAYGFHTLETLQCMVERREGAETGVASVEWLENEAVWKWRDGEGKWSAPLLNAALATSPKTKPGRMEDNAKSPVLFLVNYRDGLQSADIERIERLRSVVLQDHVVEHRRDHRHADDESGSAVVLRRCPTELALGHGLLEPDSAVGQDGASWNRRAEEYANREARHAFGEAAYVEVQAVILPHVQSRQQSAFLPCRDRSVLQE